MLHKPGCFTFSQVSVLNQIGIIWLYPLMRFDCTQKLISVNTPNYGKAQLPVSIFISHLSHLLGKQLYCLSLLYNLVRANNYIANKPVPGTVLSI